MTIDRVDPLFDDPKQDRILDLGTVRFKKINRTTYAANGVVVLKHRVDNTLNLKIEAYNFQGGEYRKYGDRTFKEFCTIFKERFGPIFHDFMAHTNSSKDCPLDPVNVKLQFNSNIFSCLGLKISELKILELNCK
jgi:hypothetical protein